MTDPTRRFVRRLGVTLLTAAAVAVCIGLVRSVASADLVSRLDAVRGYLPHLLCLELLRGVCELGTTLALLGDDRRRVPGLPLIRAQCVAFALNTCLPAGRTASETIKATLLIPRIGAARAVAIAAATQAVVLLVNASVGLIGAALASVSQLPVTAVWALLGFAAATSGTALVFVGASRWPALRARAARWPLLQASIDRFAALWQEDARYLAAAALTQCAGRLCQLAQLGVLLFALGAPHDLGRVVLTLALFLVGGAAGDLVPAQLGTIDGAFVLAADGLGISAASAVMIGLAMHAVQLAGALIAGSAAALLSVALRNRADEDMTPDRQAIAGSEPQDEVRRNHG